MSKPVRIQRKRTKGWKMPENTVSVTRPGKWGNPFRIGMFFRKATSDWSVWMSGDSEHFGNQQVNSVSESIELFRDYATKRLGWDRKWLEPLRGKNLACFCAESQPCHADVLLEIANESAAERVAVNGQ